MNLLYIGYWNLSDPLTTSTIFPHLKILSEFDWVSRIVFVNVERESIEYFDPGIKSDKIIYRPYQSVKSAGFWLEKLSDFTEAPKLIEMLIDKYDISVIIARGAPAGSIAYLVWRKTKTPFLVESFEPHAQYMRESGVWKWYDPRFWIETYFELKQKKHARGLMVVAENYRIRLKKDGIGETRLKTVPCAVKIDLFKYDLDKRNQIRKFLSISDDSLVGIYAGKYDGLYLSEEVFEIYKAAFLYFNDFSLILLCPTEFHKWVGDQIAINQLPANRILVKSVDHKEVVNYLSASDFAFATYKPGKSKMYLSPVKIGEYWANGLPVLLTSGIGDETKIINDSLFAGVLLDVKNIYNEFYLTELFRKLSTIIEDPLHRRSNANLAKYYRSYEPVRSAYDFFLRNM